MPDAIAPLAAAIITKGVGTAQERVALTAAAAFIEGPMALVPAIVRLQRAKAERRKSGIRTASASDSASDTASASTPGPAPLTDELIGEDLKGLKVEVVALRKDIQELKQAAEEAVAMAQTAGKPSPD